ncbi:TPA: hypothetical protein ROX98_003108 [Bacillus pseudomycoides]|nr:hypothetical protein [Bacillus pseudomycoides]
MGDKLPVKARLVRADNQWGMKKFPLIKVSLYKRGNFSEYFNLFLPLFQSKMEKQEGGGNRWDFGQCIATLKLELLHPF